MLIRLPTNKTVSETAAALHAAVQANHFGVMQVHNLKETMTKKGVEFARECLIFEVCQPQQAKKVLDQDMSVSTALPCRISVYEEDGKTILATLKPTTLLAMFNAPQLEGVAQEVEDTIVEIMKSAAAVDVKSSGRSFSAMRRIVLVVLVLLVGVGALGYWRGWFSLTKAGKVDVQVNQAKVQTDKKAFSKAVGEKAQELKDQVASLWEKTEGLTGDDKARAQTELGELKEKQTRLERQIKELEAASQDKFESIKQDLSKTLEEVEKKIAELKDSLGKGKDK